MKTALEIITAFAKDRNHFSISNKQYNWLEDVVNKEGIGRYVCGKLCFDIKNQLWEISPKYIPTRAYGGFVGKKQIPGYSVKLRRWVEFSNGHIRIYDDSHLDYAERDANEHGLSYRVITNPELLPQ